MALVRVYCGVATAEMAPWLTVAVVDDAGRLLDMRHISDDPAGYAYLVTLLAERSGGSCPVAIDRHDHLVAQLLAAANRPLAIADEMSLRDLGERFSDDSSYDEMQAPLSQRHAIGLARALQAGALYATAQSPSWDLDELKPLLSAHARGRRRAAGRRGRPARGAARDLPGRAAGLPRPGGVHPAQDPRCVPRARSAGWLAVNAEPGVGRRRRADRERRHRHRHRHERHHRAARGGGGVARLERQPPARLRGGGDGPAGRRRRARLRRRHGGAGGQSGRAAQRDSQRRADPGRASGRGTGVAGRAAPAQRRARRRGATEPHRPTSQRGQRRRRRGRCLSRAGTATAYGIPAPRPEPSFPSGYSRPTTRPYGTDRQRLALTTRTPRIVRDSRLPASGSPYGADATARRTARPTTSAATGSSKRLRRTARSSGSPFGGSNGSGWEQQYGSPPSYGPDTLSFSMDPLTAPLSPPDATRTPEQTREVRRGRGAARRRPVDLFAGQLGVVHQCRRPRRTDVQLGRPLRRRLACGRETHPAQRRPGDRRPACPVGCPRPTSCPARQHRRPSRCASFGTPKSIAAHTEGYFRGWRRGQEIGGFAVGQRDRAAWEFNREQRARQGAARLS